MSGNDHSQYRAIGARLAGFVHEHGANGLSSSQWRAAIADLVSENIDIRLPLQYICESKQFEALLKKTGPSEASLARDMLLANARRLYSEEIIGCLREILNGYLGIEEECVPQAPTASGLQTLSGSTATLQMHGKEHKKNENSQQVSNTVRRESRLARICLQALLLVGATGFGCLALLLFTKRLELPPSMTLLGGAKQKDHQQANPVTIFTGEVFYPGEGIPALDICATESRSRKKICVRNSKSDNAYQYQISVPPGNYWISSNNQETGEAEGWNSRCTIMTGPTDQCPSYIVPVHPAGPGIKRVDGIDISDYYFTQPLPQGGMSSGHKLLFENP